MGGMTNDWDRLDDEIESIMVEIANGQWAGEVEEQIRDLVEHAYNLGVRDGRAG